MRIIHYHSGGYYSRTQIIATCGKIVKPHEIAERIEQVTCKECKEQDKKNEQLEV